MAFHKILIANRGEIAVRVAKSARALGYRTVAVYSEADRDAEHVHACDQAVCIGPPTVAQSYLDMEKVIGAAQATGADAIHPGYGFLSENAAFAKACADAGITFIGPPAEAIELMGSKRESKLKMMDAGVPCVPGYEGADQDDDVFVAEAKKIGLPVMIKASAGGGGRGMRLVADEKELPNEIASARSEATSAFGSGELILEKAVVQPRHVEIQVFADTHGNAIHLGERDCSVQRRHQKVLEESPSPAVTPEIRAQMGEAAVNAAKAVDYVGAGTVEFLLDPDGNFYFLEMNTRLQVEHPVTEMVTGQDLVAWQIRVAAGAKLPLTQDEVTMTGHAIEARLYAEDPAQNFMPQTGPVVMWELPEGIDIRIDHAVRAGTSVTPHYDPMLAKVIAHGADRPEALRKLAAGLRDMALMGLIHNKQFLVQVLEHPEFVAGNATTAFIDEHMAGDFTLGESRPEDKLWALASLLLYLDYADLDDPELVGWRSASTIPAAMRIRCGDEVVRVHVNSAGGGTRGRRFAVEVGIPDPVAAAAEAKAATDEDKSPSEELEAGEPERFEIEVLSRNGRELVYVLDGIRERLHYADHEGTLFVHRHGEDRAFANVTYEPPQAADAAGSGVLTAPMDGAVIAVHVGEGDTVEAGQLVMVVEAMKMEHPIKADIDGKVAAIHAKEGDQVKPRQVVAEIEGDEEDGA